ncbi:lysine--tRNA ligase [Candidatus Pacearchaeota archaeon]|nr:lysine--tRNA ligase [Candidatus Pacearchaeota archaeon]
MSREDEIFKSRIAKIEELRSKNINPYTNRFERTHSSKQILDKYSNLKVEEKTKDIVKIAGRVMTLRNLGKINFSTIQDFNGKIQLVVQEDESGKILNDFFLNNVDSGDFIGVEGIVFRTKRGEISILAKKIEILTKSLSPLPEKYHGLQDSEEKLRRRYLDIIMNPEIKDLFLKKAKFWQTVRNFLLEKGFIEVETPVLEPTAGGAAATPFKTHHNSLNMDLYLRISMGELWQKKLMVAGFEKTFEIGRQFRNEGIDMEHLQDYTQMEFYWAYADYKDGMKLVEEMYKKIAIDVIGTLKFKTHDYEIDLGKKWETYDYESLIKEKTKIDIYKDDETKIKKKLDELKMEYDKRVDKWRLIDILWKYCRKQLSGPGFLVNQPVEISPLAKRQESDKRKVQQFQVILAGTEMGNGYSELNDPIDQRERFKRQMGLKAKGDTEAQEHDESFLEALEYGMPPTCGFGFSERLFSCLMDRPVRECVIFPLMRPEAKKEEKVVEKEIKNNPNTQKSNKNKIKPKSKFRKKSK